MIGLVLSGGVGERDDDGDGCVRFRASLGPWNVGDIANEDGFD